MIGGIISGVRGSFSFDRSLGAFTKAPFRAAKWSTEGALVFGMPMIAFSSSHADRGEKLPTLAAESVGLATYPVTAGLMTLGLLMVPGSGFLTPGAKAMVASMAASFPNEWLVGRINRGFNKLSQTDQWVNRLRMGGDYRDTGTAAEFRNRAVREMTNAFQPARTLLGQEAKLLHR
jgi:hypothetical protein